ncbi:MAG: NfeD family protein [Bacteroidota bacterium]
MKILRIIALLFLAFFTLSMADAARDDRVKSKILENPEKEFIVFKFEIMEQIAPPALRTTQRAFEAADTLNADFILIHMNTYGGMVDIADSIRTRIMQSTIPVIVFIDNNAASAGALLSIAADQIYMRAGGNIGAATVVDQSGEVVPDKYQSYMRSMMRSTAESKGRDPEVAQAMVDPSYEVPGISEEGKVLTFTSSEALEHGFCEGIAENVDEVLEIAGIQNYQIIEQKLTAIDYIINFLINPVVSGLLIMLILGGIYFELQTPGVGFPILLALLAAVMYFAPYYIEGLASNLELILFGLGLVLIAIEIFAIPGFGVTGVLGILSIISGLALAMVGNRGFDFSGVSVIEILVSFLIVIIAFFASLSISIYISQKVLATNRFGSFALDTVQDTNEGYTSTDVRMKDILGKTGIAFTVLRPSGKIEIDDEVYDATALTGYIDKGENIKVVKYETSQVFVVKAKV